MIRQEDLNKILNDGERAQLDYFVKNDEMREAVKKVLLFTIYHCGTLEPGKEADPYKNFALGVVAKSVDLSNEQLGVKMRASWEGINLLELGFQDLMQFKIENKRSTDKKNPAR